MTVKQLIELLSAEDPNMRVVVDGYEDGYNDIRNLEYAKIKRNIRKQNGEYYWEGDYDYVYLESEEHETAICIPR